MKTKERIILASLDLFNEQGERNISTNHIAAHLNMSPGNLYYHFRNKNDIIYEIFKNYELMVDTYLQLPSDRDIQLKDLINYLEAVFNGLWSYRFLHRDLEHLLSSDERLRSDYRDFTLRCLRSIASILHAMEKGKLSKPQHDDKRESKALNIWLIVTNWMTYLKSIHDDHDPAVNRNTIKHGVYLILDLMMPYLREDKVEAMSQLQEKYRFDDIMPVQLADPEPSV